MSPVITSPVEVHEDYIRDAEMTSLTSTCDGGGRLSDTPLTVLERVRDDVIDCETDKILQAIMWRINQLSQLVSTQHLDGEDVDEVDGMFGASSSSSDACRCGCGANDVCQNHSQQKMLSEDVFDGPSLSRTTSGQRHSLDVIGYLLISYSFWQRVMDGLVLVHFHTPFYSSL